MLEKVLSWLRLVWDAGVKTDKNSKDINAIQEQNQQFSESIKLLVEQRQHDREMSESRVRLAEERIKSLEKEIESLRRELRDAQEKTELKMRLAISEYLRQLPPSDK